MTNKDLHESNVTIAGSIILGAIIIAWAIVWAAGPRTLDQQAGTAPVAGIQAPSGAPGAAPAGGDLTKLKTTGEPTIGNINAPVTIAYWFDYQCPFCQRLEETVMGDLVKNYVKTGKAKVVFKDFAFLGADSTRLAVAARAVWDVAPDRFYDWHHAIFVAQGQENSGWATDAKIAEVTAQVLGQAKADQVMALMKSNATAYQSAIDADRTEGNSYGVTATPAMVIGSGKKSTFLLGARPYSDFSKAIDSFN